MRKRSHENHLNKYRSLGLSEEVAQEIAWKDLEKEMEQGFQGWEYKFNSVSSSRGDYPFITMTSGTDISEYGKLVTKTMLEVRAGGQGKPGHKKPVLFPKIVFLYDENLHATWKAVEKIFLKPELSARRRLCIRTGSALPEKAMSPSIYKDATERSSARWDAVHSYLHGMNEAVWNPADEKDEPVFVGRFNIGAVSLHLPMILAKAETGEPGFLMRFWIITWRLIRKLHIRTYEYLGELRASTNPLAYCEGGFYGGHLKIHDKIKPAAEIGNRFLWNYGA